MEIHNFFSDVLISVKSLFNDHIFKGRDLIKTYSFNIANRTFELDQFNYSPNYELPAVIVNINEENYTFGERPQVIMHQTLYNMMSNKVLIDANNPDTKIVWLQEEHVSIPIDITINVNDALDAKDIEFSIKRFLPLNKDIMIHEFTSFFEIDPGVLAKMGIDTNSYIINLFSKLNENTGRLMFCYSMKYRPIMRLDSINANIDKSAATQSVTMTLTYFIQMPMWLTWENYQYIERINFIFLRIGMDPISSNPVTELFNITPEGKKYPRVFRQILINNVNKHNIKIEEPIEDNIRYVTFDFKPHIDDIKLSEEYVFHIFDTNGRMNFRIPFTFYENENKVTFRFEYNEFMSKYNPTLTNPLIIQICKQIEHKGNNDHE